MTMPDGLTLTLCSLLVFAILLWLFGGRGRKD
jgi:hypothetical protein